MFLVSLVKVLSIRDSLPHLRSIVLYGEDEVPSDAKVNYNVHHLIFQNGEFGHLIAPFRYIT